MEENTVIEKSYLKDAYLTKQIITYMGNKRKLLPVLDSVFQHIKHALGKDRLTMGDGFSGSGVVSRLMTYNASAVYANDLAGYSETLNNCFLKHRTETQRQKLSDLIDTANVYVDDPDKRTYINATQDTYNFIQQHWAPSSDDVEAGERVYFTADNGKRIDKYRYFIDHYVPREYQCCLLAMLLVEASIKNNTSGHFAAYYKKDAIGHYGGKKELDLHRIMKPIRLYMPEARPSKKKTKVHITRMDTNEWARAIPELDVVYYDPPYNKHPYNIFYFLLDIINDWDMDVAIPDTTRGQPKNWVQSKYNSLRHAKACFADLIANTKSKYIMVSYNSKGIIPKDDMKEILATRGTVTEYSMTHKTYNRMVGIAKYKAQKEQKEISEYLFVVTTD